MLLQLLFALGKFDLGWRRCIVCNNPTVENFALRFILDGFARTQHAAFDGSKRSDARDFRTLECFVVESQRRLPHRLRIHKNVAGHCGNGA